MNVEGDICSYHSFLSGFLYCFVFGMFLPAPLRKCSVKGPGLSCWDFAHTLPSCPHPSAWPRTRPAKNRCLCKWTVDLSSLVMHSPFGRKSRKWVFGLISETSSLPFLHNLFDVWWGFEDLNLNIYKGMSEHIAVCKGTHSRLHEFF